MLEHLLQVRLIRWYSTSVRRQFMLAEDTYDNWAILAADEGSFEYQVGEESGMAQFGDIVICPPGVKLERHARDRLSFLFLEFYWESDQEKPQTADIGLPYGKVSFHRIDRFTSIFSLIRDISDTDLQEHFVYKQHLLRDLLCLYAIERQDAMNPIVSKDSLVRAAVQQIHKRAFEALSLKSLADQAALSQSHFSRRFQADMGVSPIAYLTAIRMRKAQHLLINSDLTLEEIALQCGYQNGFYLSRVFKNHYGTSPSAFRQNYRI
ncbi:AraC family transcriptional regulator [Paenibacillus chungangensis]|uniref:AraC family transcriptional regulator n=1 Tax=Paenibacillus chungangensis TaxID=696535 RepID=A0ABW3HRJ3_9BACL